MVHVLNKRFLYSSTHSQWCWFFAAAGAAHFSVLNICCCVCCSCCSLHAYIPPPLAHVRIVWVPPPRIYTPFILYSQKEKNVVYCVYALTTHRICLLVGVTAAAVIIVVLLVSYGFRCRLANLCYIFISFKSEFGFSIDRFESFAKKNGAWIGFYVIQSEKREMNLLSVT